jgi:hypothetical protein
MTTSVLLAAQPGRACAFAAPSARRSAPCRRRRRRPSRRRGAGGRTRRPGERPPGAGGVPRVRDRRSRPARGARSVRGTGRRAAWRPRLPASARRCSRARGPAPEQVADGAGVGAERVVTAGLRGAPVAEEIWRDDGVALGQPGKDLVPGRRVPGNAVDERQHRPRARRPIGDPMSVEDELTRGHDRLRVASSKGRRGR